ncbi:MAG TPA: DEAD/DEAH box helicase, partial [Rhizomicrobium sp.]
MSEAALKPRESNAQEMRAGVLLPLPLGGIYDYRLDEPLPRGAIVAAPLGPRLLLGVVWGEADGTVSPEKLKRAEPLPGHPQLPASLCDFIDWTARYTLSPPGSMLAMALRARQAFEPEIPRTGFIRGSETPSRMTPARARVLGLVEDGLARSIPAIAEEANVTPQVIRGLIDAGALAAISMPEFASLPMPDPEFSPPNLNTEQAHAAAEISSHVAAREFAATLLDGVTGSGKTETYFEVVAEALRQKRQVLILLPEIALTVQFLERFAARFGCRPAEWHSDLSQKERKHIFRAVLSGEARVVVGARSALFLPFSELGLIIVDEEHEQAYKQEDGAIYHARDMAVVRGRIETCAVVLASATPSLETYVNATTG